MIDDIVASTTREEAGAVLSEILLRVAREIEKNFPDPNPLASLFEPYVGSVIVASLRREARSYRLKENS